jgi:hypothetical protein
MLPGFRFLFAAIVLTISTLVFGLGAAALLRASHEQFASLPTTPSAPALPPIATADASPNNTTLALLRVDTPELDAAPAPRATPAPVSDHAAPALPPAPEAKETVVTPAPPDIVASEPNPTPASAAATSEPFKTIGEVETAATASPTPETSQVAPEAAVTQPETSRPAPTATPTDIATAEPAEAQPAQAETIKQTERTPPEPVKIEAAQAEPVAPRIPEAALVNEPRSAPLEPADAPIKTAMLTPTEPAPAAIPDPVAAITGPIPLPRSREWALAQGHAAQRAARARKLAATRARPRPVVRQPIRPQVQVPAAAPNPFFPFGQ